MTVPRVQAISRRRALQLGGLGITATVLGAAGLARTVLSGTARVGPGGSAGEPSTIRSVDGLLRVTLEAAEGPVAIAGRPAWALRYNGSLPGSTLRLRPGDRLQIRLVNGLAAATNLHVHGLHVSPSGNSDNPFVTVRPGESFDYDYRLPDDHPPGVFWYHPHHHGSVADQIFGGLYGAIVVDDPDGSAGIPITRERVLVVSDITIDEAGRVAAVGMMSRMAGREGDLVLVNGRLRPVFTARKGERERWRIVNACVSRYLRLRFDGQAVALLGVDSGRLRNPAAASEIVLVPGNRADVLVTVARGGSIVALPYDRGVMPGRMGGMMGGPRRGDDEAVVLADLRVVGNPVTPLAPLPAVVAGPARDLREAVVGGRRRLSFAMGMGAMGGGMGFTIDGRQFDDGRVDQEVVAGSVEEWTITNTSPMDHPLHLHVWPVQVLSVNGRTLTEPTWRDVVNVPALGEVTVRIPFDRFTGRTVYHCHILDHEDNGMMGVVQVR